MAIQFDCPIVDGLDTAEGAYVRLEGTQINKKEGVWYLTSDIAIYRDSNAERKLPSQVVDRFKMSPFDPAVDNLGSVYTALKQWLVDNEAVPAVTTLDDITDV